MSVFWSESKRSDFSSRSSSFPPASSRVWGFSCRKTRWTPRNTPICTFSWTLWDLSISVYSFHSQEPSFPSPVAECCGPAAEWRQRADQQRHPKAASLHPLHQTRFLLLHPATTPCYYTLLPSSPGKGLLLQRHTGAAFLPPASALPTFRPACQCALANEPNKRHGEQKKSWHIREEDLRKMCRNMLRCIKGSVGSRRNSRWQHW